MTQAMPAFFRRNSTSSSMAPNCEKTRPLAFGSLLIIFRISSKRASIFVLLWKSDGFTFCMMFLFPSFWTEATPEAAVAEALQHLLPFGLSFGGVSQIASVAFFATDRVSFG